MKTKAEIVAIRKRALLIAASNLAFGLGAMLFSLQEQSVGWTFFVWVAGLQGISIGLLGGIGYSQVLLNTIPDDWKLTPAVGFMWSIITYWAPVIATFLFGMMLYTTLPDAALPRSKIEGDSNAAGFMQSLVTFFNANGCVWLMVMLVSRKIERAIDDSSTATPFNGANA